MSYDNNLICIDYNVCSIIHGWSLSIKNITTADSPYTALNEDTIIFADATGGPIDVILHKCDCKQNPSYIIKKVDSSPNFVTINPSPASTINEGFAFYDIKSQAEVSEFVYDDTRFDWRKIMNDLSILTNKGDLITNNGLIPVRLPVGLDGQVLSADSTAPGGLKYVSVGGGEINTGANVGTGTGKVFRDKTGTVLNFKSIIAGNDIGITNGINELTLSVAKGYEIIQTSAITAPNPNLSISEIKINTNGGTIISVLADPTSPVLGMEKTFLITSKTGTNKYQVNPTTFVNGTGILFEYVGQSIKLIWTSLGWANAGGSGATFL